MWSRFRASLGLDGAVAVLALLVASGIFQDLLPPPPTGPAIVAALHLAIAFYFAAGLYFRFGAEVVRWLLRSLPTLAVVVGIAFLSAIWSPDPAMTLRLAAELTGTTLIGVYIGYGFPVWSVMRILFWTLAIIVVLNVAAALLVPDYGVTNVAHRGYVPYVWRGAMGNKNVLGNLAALAALFFLAGTLKRRIEPGPGYALFGLSLLTAVLAQAATALVALANALLAIACFALSKRLRLPSQLLLIVMLLVMTCSALMIAFYWRDEFTALLARDPDFTNRTAVWQDSLQLIARHPLTGYGYGAVWGLKGATWFPELESTRMASDAQNGLLNLATQLGVPVALVALGQVLATLFRSVRAFALRPSGFCLFVIAYSVYFIVRNIAESDLYVARSDEWMLFVALSVAVVRYLQRDAAFDGRPPRTPDPAPGWRRAGAGR